MSDFIFDNEDNYEIDQAGFKHYEHAKEFWAYIGIFIGLMSFFYFFYLTLIKLQRMIVFETDDIMLIHGDFIPAMVTLGIILYLMIIFYPMIMRISTSVFKVDKFAPYLLYTVILFITSFCLVFSYTKFTHLGIVKHDSPFESKIYHWQDIERAKVELIPNDTKSRLLRYDLYYTIQMHNKDLIVLNHSKMFEESILELDYALELNNIAVTRDEITKSMVKHVKIPGITGLDTSEKTKLVEQLIMVIND